MKIAIVGMMGSGKSEIGQRLSSRLDLRCIDLDVYIENSIGMPIFDIFRMHGEAQFREHESRALTELATRDKDFVLCCGGGVVISDKNREILLRHFLSVWLDVPLHELVHRLMDQRSNRPLLRGPGWKEKLKELYEYRSPLYEASAHLRYRWEPGQGAEESATEIERLIRAQLIPGDPQE